MVALVLLAAASFVLADPPPWCSKSPDQAAGVAFARHLEPWDDPLSPPSSLHTEHGMPGQPRYDASVVAERGLERMRDAALAWRNGGGEVWRQRAERVFASWIVTYRPDLNPIDETSLDALIETYALIRDDLPPSARAASRAWLIAWGRAYVNAIDAAKDGPRPSQTFINNWQSHRVKLITMIAVATGDRDLEAEAQRLFRQQIAENVHAGGEVIDFRMRDALHYVIYDLEPLLQAALAARTVGQDWYGLTVGGASLQQAVHWAEPYATGEKTHQEFVHSTVAFDAERAAAGVKGYSGPFDPHTARRLFWLAAAFEPRYTALAARLGPEPASLALCGQ